MTPQFKTIRLLMIMTSLLFGGPGYAQDPFFLRAITPDEPGAMTERFFGPVKYVLTMPSEIDEGSDPIKDRDIINFLFFNEEKKLSIQRVKEKDEDAYIIKFTYGQLDRLVQSSVMDERGNAIANLSYNKDGQLQELRWQQTDKTEDVLKWTYHYDSAGYLTLQKGSIDDEEMFLLEYTYKDGKLTEKVRIEYNAFGYPMARKETFNYDAQGNLAQKTVMDEDEDSVIYQYNAKGEMIAWMDPEDQEAGETYDYTYDAQGNWVKAIVRSKDGTSHILRRRIAYYDYSGLLPIAPDSQREFLRRNIKKVQATVLNKTLDTVDPKAIDHWELGLDEKGRRRYFTYYDGTCDNTVKYDYTYDRFGNRVLVHQKDSNGLSFYSVPQYSLKGALTSLITLMDGWVFQHTYEYDEKGRNVKFQDKVWGRSEDEKVEILTYNADGDPATMTIQTKMDEEVVTETYRYQYDENGNWTNQETYIDEKLTKVTERKIEYY